MSESPAGLGALLLSLCGACTVAVQRPGDCRQRGELGEWLGLPRELCPECEARIAQCVRVLTSQRMGIVSLSALEGARLRLAPTPARPRRRAGRAG